MGRRVPVWVDQICIDQGNDAEKSREVARMDEIYRGAKTTIIWLGEEAQDSGLAMSCIPGLIEPLSRLDGVPFIRKLDEYGLPPAGHPVWPAISNLVWRPWFERLWTFQEAVLANSLTVLCGDQTIAWNDLSTVVEQLKSDHMIRWVAGLAGRRDSHDRGGFLSVAYISINREAYHEARTGGRQTPFSLYLYLAQSRTCSDPHHQVFGLLSLASPNFRAKLHISYTQDARKLFLETGKACLGEPGGITYLTLRCNRASSPGLPSWCCDLCAPLASCGAGHVYGSAGRAPDDKAPDIVVRTFADADHIEAEGFRADRVRHIGPTLGLPHLIRAEAGFNFAGTTLTWLTEGLRMAQTHGRKGGQSDEDLLLSHIYTVTTSTIGERPDCSTLLNSYNQYVQTLRSMATSADGCSLPSGSWTVIEELDSRISGVNQGQTYFTTYDGRLGLGSCRIQPDDHLIVLYGGKSVFVLREKEGTDGFELVGDAFVHGLMELSRTPKELKERRETFTIY